MEEAENNQAMLARAVYILYLVSLVSGITALVGMVMAHVYHGRSNELWSEHFRYQYRTFWIGLLYGLISMALVPIGLGVVLLLGVLIWFLVRTVRGLVASLNNEPLTNVDSWFI